MIDQLLHQLIYRMGSAETNRFKKALRSPRQSQQEILTEILKAHQKLPWSPLYQKSNSENFFKSPVTTWKDYESFFGSDNRLKWQRSLVERFEPTSGSTFERKWIPYTKEFLNEINRAASVWMSDMYRQYPQIRTGSHYWSLSWLPQDLRKNTTTDDSQLFPWWKRWILSKIFLVPKEVSHVSSEAAWRIATRAYLLSDANLTFVSIWSPRFLTALLDMNDQEITELQECFTNKKWMIYERDLQKIPFPKIVEKLSIQDRIVRLKNRLKLISCWTSSSSKAFSDELKNDFPNTKFQGKGLWATEGVLTIPYQGQKPLAIRSHYYEFRNWHSQKMIQIEDLKVGDLVSPLITTGSGLLRYEIGDCIMVTGFVEKTPSFEFLGRPGSVDLVGEKMDMGILYGITHELQKTFPHVSYWQWGYRSKPAVYCLGVPSNMLTPEALKYIEESVEVSLQKHHHYRVARQLQQLMSVKVISLAKPYYQEAKAQSIFGQIKPTDFVEFDSN